MSGRRADHVFRGVRHDSPSVQPPRVRVETGSRTGRTGRHAGRCLHPPHEAPPAGRSAAPRGRPSASIRRVLVEEGARPAPPSARPAFPTGRSSSRSAKGRSTRAAASALVDGFPPSIARSRVGARRPSLSASGSRPLLLDLCAQQPRQNTRIGPRHRLRRSRRIPRH